MAVLWSDLLVPDGELEEGWFPDDDVTALEDRLTGYITRAEAKAADITDPDEQDEAVTAYAYHLAYTAIWARMSGDPSNAAIVNEESVAYSPQLVNNFKILADEKLAEFEELVPPMVDDVVATAIPPTMSTPVVYGW